MPFGKKIERVSNCSKVSSSIDEGTAKQINNDKTFMQNFIVREESWVYGYDIETEVQSSQQVAKGSSRSNTTWHKYLGPVSR